MKPKYGKDASTWTDSRYLAMWQSSLHSSIMQGASSVTEHNSPFAIMLDVQQSSPVKPEMVEQPLPPHCPQPATQHTPDFSIPSIPLLHMEAGEVR